MSEPGDLFVEAWRCHEAGDDRSAELLCLRILEAEPHRVEALHLLGRLALKWGRPDVAVSYLSQAVRQDPTDTVRHFELATAYQAQTRYDEALASYRAALELRPDFPEAHNNLGLALHNVGQHDAAVLHLQQAIRLRPDYTKAYLNLGAAQGALGKHHEAVAAYEQLIKFEPHSAEGYTNLGVALSVQARLDEAIACLRYAVWLQPRLVAAWYNLGNELARHYQLALAASAAPGAASADPAELAEALDCYEQALLREPGDVNVHWNRALIWLAQGNFALGWPEYEWRLRNPQGPCPMHVPRWDGAPLAGKTILLHPEQGLGDTIQFVRYAKRIKQLGARVLVGSQPALQRLLSRCPDIDEAITEIGPSTPIDVLAALPSLPGIFGTTLQTIPAEVPYLFEDPDLTEHWRQQLGPPQCLRVGIAWQGYPGHVNDRNRSIPLTAFAALARLANVQLYSLQWGHGIEQLDTVRFERPIVALGQRFTDLADSAAVIRNLDLVVTVDSALAHLAGALAMPVWVLLPAVSDWRWLLGRTDSPWYPTMRLFRQQRVGDWDDVMQRVAWELSKQNPSAADSPQSGCHDERADAYYRTKH